MSRISISIRLALILSLTMLLVATGLGTVSGQPAPVPPAGPQPQSVSTSTSGCVASKIKWTTDNVTETIPAAGTVGLVNMPGTRVDFMTSAGSCLKVEFSAVLYSTGYLYLAAQLDGFYILYPGSIFTWAPNNQAIAFNWMWPAGLSAGGHTVRILWYDPTGTATVSVRSVAVHFQ